MYFFRLDINIEYDPYYNKHMNILHQVLYYNQTYNFAFNHDHEFWTISIIKHVWTL
jgi:hypothetical protein